jgi:hypothetical protein
MHPGLQVWTVHTKPLDQSNGDILVELIHGFLLALIYQKSKDCTRPVSELAHENFFLLTRITHPAFVIKHEIENRK